jgi:hypothetical protein
MASFKDHHTLWLTTRIPTQTWTGDIAPRYRQSDKKGKSRILDEFVQATGYNRKYAPHILTRWGKETRLVVDGKPVRF